jgi:hypothetical protein
MRIERHAAQVASDRLQRARGLLGSLGEDERQVVERLAYAVAAGVAECLAEEARRDSAIAAAVQGRSLDFVALSHKPAKRDGPRGRTEP